MKQQMTPALLNKAGAASYLAVSVRTVDHLVARGELRVIRVPNMRRIAFATTDLERLAEQWIAADR